MIDGVCRAGHYRHFGECLVLLGGVPEFLEREGLQRRYGIFVRYCVHMCVRLEAAGGLWIFWPGHGIGRDVIVVVAGVEEGDHALYGFKRVVF